MSATRSPRWLDAHRAAWDALASRAETPLLEADWILSGVDTLHPERDFRLVVIERDGRLCAAAPLVAVGRGPASRLELAGMAALYEPGGLLYEDDAALAALAEAVVGLGRPLRLARLPAASPAVGHLTRAVRRPGVVVARSTASSLAIAVAGTWEAYEATLSSRLTSNVRRLARRAARAHPVRTEVLAPRPAEVPALFERFVEIEASGWKGRASSALSARPHLRGFFARYLDRVAAAGRLRVAQLWFGDRLAAAEIAIVAYRRWWQLKIAFDDGCADFYPGLQLTHATVREAFESGLEAFEFLGSAADWERRWNPEERRFVTVAAYPRTAAGLLGLGLDVGRRAAGRLGRADRR